MDNNKNILLAIFLTIFVLFIWQVLVPTRSSQTTRSENVSVEKTASNTSKSTNSKKNLNQEMPFLPPISNETRGGHSGDNNNNSGNSNAAFSRNVQQNAQHNVQKAGQKSNFAPNSTRSINTVNKSTRIENSVPVTINTPSLKGSINLFGGNIDVLLLKKFKQTVYANSSDVTLFSSRKSKNAYFTFFGWRRRADVSGKSSDEQKMPDIQTLWSLDTSGTNSGSVGNTTLSASRPVTIVWDNGYGLTFRRTFSIDTNYMFTIRDEVLNHTTSSIILFPYALINKKISKNYASALLHEGVIGDFKQDGFEEISYTKLVKGKSEIIPHQNGWIGLTDKYWASALVPPQNIDINVRYMGYKNSNGHFAQVDYMGNGMAVKPGQSVFFQHKLFAGAKVASIIDSYERAGIYRFDLMIDWGWLYFLTKPMFYALDFIGQYTHNFGIAILILTVLIKLAFFPLTNKSYVTMGKMKKLQPEIDRVRKVYKEDKTKMQKELMGVYKKEKLNPFAGCLPILIQIPVFFALYKVLYGTIEMRHAPFFGWIRDLSAPDPTTIFNLFGLIPWTPPHFLMIGAWPIIMGVTMFVQQRMTPTPIDTVQQRILMLMPVIFTVMLAQFPAGLVIYWAWNNTLSVLQQGYIMRKNGMPIGLFKT